MCIFSCICGCVCVCLCVFLVCVCVYVRVWGHVHVCICLRVRLFNTIPLDLLASLVSVPATKMHVVPKFLKASAAQSQSQSANNKDGNGTAETPSGNMTLAVSPHDNSARAIARGRVLMMGTVVSIGFLAMCLPDSKVPVGDSDSFIY